MESIGTDVKQCDCLIIGAGPAGLIAALYLSRFRRHIRVIDSGESRAAYIALSHNVAGFPKGISGVDLLQRLREQTEHAGVTIEKGKVTRLENTAEYFTVHVGNERYDSRTVLIATGAADEVIPPNLPAEATWEGYVRWCPVCDGYESLDQRVVLIGEPKHGLKHVLFLRSYTRELTLVIPVNYGGLRAADRQTLAEANITLVQNTPLSATFSKNLVGNQLHFSDGGTLGFNVLYPMTGGHGRSRLASNLGARCDEHGGMLVGSDQQTTVPGLFAAGDVTCTLKQINVSVAEGALAATAIHRQLPANFR